MGPVPTYTFADLSTAQTQATIRARLITALTARGLPTASWAPTAAGGAENTVVDMVAGSLAQLVGQKVALAVLGRFLDKAVGDTLTFLGKHFYLLDRNLATFTIQNVRLSSVPGAPSNSFAPGDVWVMASATGHRYVSLDQIELPPGAQGASAPMARFQAELPGSIYSDPEGTIDTMVTAPAGVSCTNIRPSDYLPARLLGTSTGLIDVEGQDDDHVVPPVNAVVRVRIDASGNVGAGGFSFKLDAGPWTSGGPITTVFFAPNEDTWFIAGNRIIFKNGGASPSFIAGDVFTFLRADAILQQGADLETEASLRDRCRSRWPTLSLVPTESVIKLWAQAASPEVHKVIADADPLTPGAILVTLASSAGPASAAAQSAVADYIAARLLGFKGVPSSPVGGSPEETVTVQSAVAHPLTPAGVVTVPRAKLVSAQQAADLAWLAYLASVGIGGVVILAELEQLILDAGAITLSAITLNGVAANVQLAANEVPVPADGTSLTANLSWRPI